MAMLTTLVQSTTQALFDAVMAQTRNTTQFSSLEEYAADALFEAKNGDAALQEPLRLFIREVGNVGGESVAVRKAWLLAVVALNEEEMGDDAAILSDENLPIEDLKTKARSFVIQGTSDQKRFEQLLKDADRLDVYEEELREALLFVIEARGYVKPMEDFLSLTIIQEEEEEEDEEEDDEYAAVRLLAHTILAPEFPAAIREHPEWAKFLI